MMLKKLQGCNLALPTSTFPPLTLKLSSQPTFETSPPMIITNGTSYVQGKSIVSDVFWVSGVPWRLKVYPMGNQKSKAHTSLFLEKLTPEEVHYVIQFRSVQHPSIIKEFQTKFTAKKAFGLSHFYPHALMDTQASGIQLSFQFSVRPLTYLQKSLDLENYIAWLKQPSSFPEMDAELEEMDIAFNHQDALTTFS
ncbi:hypothetical protein HMI55_002490 [Coelomomyces lativittatus]|nr:hypothetical protein HMI55_002490 [Coelomomyces lativittatus]